MAMEAAGLGFAVVGEARTLAKSVVERIETVLEGREDCEGLSASLKHLADNLGGVEKLKENFPDALPECVTDLFDRTLNRVRESLSDADAVEKDIARVFAESSSFFDKVKAKSQRVLRAKKLKSKMKSTEAKIKEASNELLHLTTQLTNAITITDISAKEKFRSVVCAPGRRTRRALGL